MRHYLSVATVLFAVVAGRASVYEVTADWLDSHALAVHAGDQARILGTDTQRSVNFDNLSWDGGELSLVGCRLELAAGRVNPPLPMIVSVGQVLNLEQTWIQGAATAILLDGGTARLTDVTLASSDANILSNHASSRLELRNVNLCNATVGLDLEACDSLLVDGGLFLTNGTALRCNGATQVSLQNCLFQGNEKAIVVTATGNPPIFLANVDLVDARYALVENLSPNTIDLADAYVDEPAQILGFSTRSGVNPDAPVHPLKTALPPLVDDGEIEVLTTPLNSVCADDGIPCIISLYRVYESVNPYEEFVLVSELAPGTDYHMTLISPGRKFYKMTACIGEWR